jgi:hypothetical protein
METQATTFAQLDDRSMRHQQMRHKDLKWIRIESDWEKGSIAPKMFTGKPPSSLVDIITAMNVICCRYGVLGDIDEFSKGGMKQGGWQGCGETRGAIAWDACILLLCVGCVYPSFVRRGIFVDPSV